MCEQRGAPNIQKRTVLPPELLLVPPPLLSPHPCLSSSCRFSSLFGILSIFFLVFTTAYHSIEALVTNGFDHSWGLADVTLWPTSFSNIISATPIIMFAFTCQVNVFSIYEELEDASPRR